MPFLDRVFPRLDRVDRDRLEEILRSVYRERKSLGKIFNLLEEGIVVVDSEGKIRFANRAAASHLIPAREEKIEGKSLAESILDPQLRELVETALGQRTGVLAREIALIQPMRDQVLVTVLPVEDSSGAYDGAVVVVRSISAELARQARYAQVRRMQTFGIMAAGIAHELGNPLNSLDIHLQLIERKVKRMRRGKRDDLIELISIAKEEVRRLENIISQFLKATRPVSPALKEGDIVAILDRTLDFMEPEIERRGVSLLRRYSPSIPPLLVNSDQMRQVFINLIRNAVQAMPGAGRIHVKVECARGNVCVSFSDSGPGIPEDQLDKIFEPYFTTRQTGAGLGLMIVQRIVSEHGGEIVVSSTPGKGTTMTIRLPIPKKYARMLPAEPQAG